MTVKTLELIFQTAEGKNATISIPDPVEPLDPAIVNQVMAQIVTKNIFQFTSGEIVAAVSARTIERTVTDIALA
ncbi:DUF2922 domain-containing protein [Tepidibacillus infernus]|uniref:DUF2922 domain-containing protein n=1 Tax=Tepidibacillus decaturensis TaxID=1413211 RepID=A0A135L4J3_9BACI|nr:DUF2922 domain-containing protein [Tepidibacillus decaturensis]KXG43934.1 hypothetical protein U473_07885 [Tepidibacillus decaturensis]